MMNEIQLQALPLTGMRALVTGGAQGIGAGICQGLARAGAAVAIVDLQVDKAQYLTTQIMESGGRAIAVSADISSEDGCRQAVATTIGDFGGLDILVNCAAPGRNRDMLGKLADADWDIHQKVVLNAAVFFADAASDYLAASGLGTIVNISSVTSYSIGVDHCSWPYHVSKAGLDQLTRWLAVRFGGQGVRVNAIAPGLVDREAGPKLSDNMEHRAVIKEIVPLGRAGNNQDIAQAVVFLCSKQSSYITGQVLTIDGGLGINEVFSTSLKTFKSGVGTSL
jgi:NAD(P)-dependent dehydrogenase (short-subunit alcohol dehydrogenase family)